tara:strand:+ start:3269 stop:3865 length:597 start_codon:yes stop_codon:yes gene_type:complete
MIKFNNISTESPYVLFKDLYNSAVEASQKNIEAVCIGSYSKKDQEVNARFVNLKFVNANEFIFFSNYKSLKAKDFISNNQIVAVIYWNSIDVQIRMKSKIHKLSQEFNQAYFAKRDMQKNALAISSQQSQSIESYEAVKKNFNESLESANLTKCPEYWGGYSFIPYSFEFWKGHGSRINKREVYKLQNGCWTNSYLQP